LELKAHLKNWDTIVSHRRPHDEIPPYVIRGGLCFTPLSMGYLLTIGGVKKALPPVRHLYRHALSDPSLELGRQFPVLSQVLPDEINQGAKGYIGGVLVKINDSKIEHLKDIDAVIASADAEFLSFHFLGQELPLVMHRQELLTRGKDLLKHYRVVGEDRY
jgi:hypothetical protein